MSKHYVQEQDKLTDEKAQALVKLLENRFTDENIVCNFLKKEDLICSIELKGSGQGNEEFYYWNETVYYVFDGCVCVTDLSPDEILAILDDVFTCVDDDDADDEFNPDLFFNIDDLKDVELKMTKTVAKLKGETEAEETSLVLLEGNYSHLHGTTVEFYFRATEEEWANRSEQHKALYGDDGENFTALTEEEAKAELEKGAVYIEMTVLE